MIIWCVDQKVFAKNEFLCKKKRFIYLFESHFSTWRLPYDQIIWLIFLNEVQARAARATHLVKRFFQNISYWKNLFAVSRGKLWINMFLIRTHTCIVRKVFCSEKIIWSVARTISLRDLFKIFRKHYFRQRDILIWKAGSPCNTPHNSSYSAKEHCLIKQYV